MASCTQNLKLPICKVVCQIHNLNLHFLYYDSLLFIGDINPQGSFCHSSLFRQSLNGTVINLVCPTFIFKLETTTKVPLGEKRIVFDVMQTFL